MAHKFNLPDPGEGIHEAEILDVLVSEGDEVEEGQNVLVVETDKASIEIPSPESGQIEKIHVSAGDVAAVGDTVITFADGAGTSAEGKAVKEKDKPNRTARGEGSDDDEPESVTAKSGPDQAEHAQQENTESAAADTASDHEAEEDEQGKQKPAKPADAKRQSTEKREPHKRVKSVPATRRLAKELGVDLGTVKPTGSHGRITDDDVRRAVGANGDRDRRKGALPEFERFGKVERKPLRSIRRATANRMATAWASIPHVTHMDSIPIDRFEKLRQRHKTDPANQGGHLSMTALVVKAAIAALRDFPRFNASFDVDSEEIVEKQYYNIGVAVATERGLLVPVIRNGDRKSVLDISKELSKLTDKVRSGDASKEELSGGSFTITNVGPLGGRAFTPVINWPEAAILGIGEARIEPVATFDDDGSVSGFKPCLMLPVCLSFDHRLNDGADAARFVSRLREILTDPEEFILSA